MRAGTARAALAVALLLVPALALTAEAADPGRTAWTPHDPIGAASGIAIAADGPTMAVALGAPLSRTTSGAPTFAPSDLVVYDAETGAAYLGDKSAPGVLYPGRSHVAVNRTGEVVVTLGRDALSDLLTNPDVQDFLEVTYHRIPAGARWASATPETSAQTFGNAASAAGLAVSADGSRVVVGANLAASGTYLVRGFTFSGGALQRSFEMTGAGWLNALAATDDLSQVLVVANVPEAGANHSAVMVVPFVEGRASFTYHDRRPEAVNLTQAVIARDGARFAAAGPNGTLLTFENRGALTPAPTVTTVGNGTVAALALSGDGRRLGVGVGQTVQHYEFLEAAPRALWVYNATANVTSLSYNLTGGLVVAAVPGVGVVGFGDEDASPLWTVGPTARLVAINDAGTLAFVASPGSSGQSTLGALTIARSFVFEFPGGAKTGPVGTATPDQPARFEVVLRNLGAAPETYRFDAADGSGVTLTAEPASPTLRPGEVRRITLSADPGRATPGDATFNVTATALTSGLTDNVTLTARLAPKVNVTLFYDGQTELAATPGGATTLLLGVKNDGNKDAAIGIRATQSVTRGETWSLAIDPPSFTLAPNTLTTAAVTLTPPASTPNGTANTVTFSLDGQDVSGTVQVTLRVNPSVGVGLDATSRARFVEPGRNVTYNVTVLNNGTLPRVYEVYADVTATGGKNWVATTQSEPFRLEAGANRTLQVRVFAPDDATASDRATITVTARTVPELVNETERVYNLTLFANAAPPPTPTSPEDEGGRGIPAPSIFLTATGLLAAVALRRRLSR